MKAMKRREPEVFSMKAMKNIKDFLWVVVHPKTWKMAHKYSDKTEIFMQLIMHDQKVRNLFLLGRDKPENKNHLIYIINIEKMYTIWFGNFPYAYATYQKGDQETTRPSRRTVYEFKKFMDTLPEKFPEYFL